MKHSNSLVVFARLVLLVLTLAITVFTFASCDGLPPELQGLLGGNPNASCEHTYDNNCDTDCNKCGATRTTEHTYDNACDTDCNACGATRTTEHTYDNACDVDCNACGATRETEHAYADGVCGVCGAKMRYQKWSDGKYKIYCYSRDSSKTHLHKGAKCDNVRISAEELEKTVINDVFSLKYEEKTAQEDSTDVLEVLEKTRTSLRRRLSRLYELYSNAEDDVLLEEINRLKEEISKIDGEILTEKESRTISLKSRQQLEKLNALQSVWDVMTVEEKQSVLRELIEKIVITNDSVEIFYTENIK